MDANSYESPRYEKRKKRKVPSSSTFKIHTCITICNLINLVEKKNSADISIYEIYG